MGRPRLALLRSGRGLLKPFERAENGMDRLGLFGIGKYPVLRRYVLRPVVMLLEANRVRRHISAGSEYAALVDTHIPPISHVLKRSFAPALKGMQLLQPGARLKRSPPFQRL